MYIAWVKLHIKVKPNSKTDEITREGDGSYKVKIKAPPVDGKANKYLINYLSAILKLPKSSIVLTKGETAAFKTLQINANEEQVINRLNEVAA